MIAVLVINRLLAPCALRNIAKWVKDTGLHLLLGIADPGLLNYDRLADALMAVYPHWQTIATEITLRAVEAFQLKIDTVHYDLTSDFFHGKYEGSDPVVTTHPVLRTHRTQCRTNRWVTFGYSRDDRPDKRQVNIGVSATDDGEVVLPGGCGIYAGDTNDGTTTVPTHERLHEIFQRSDLLVTGDSIMHDAENMLLISRAHGRFLGPPKMTKHVRQEMMACTEEEFETLPASPVVTSYRTNCTGKAGHEVKAVFRRLWFEAKVKMTPAEREREAARRKRLGIGGRRPVYREVRY